MELRTYSELKTEVLMETDTEAEDFIQSDEIRGYFRDAINEAEAHIHKLGLEDDYFLTSQSYSLTNGLTHLAMPTNIYATKIRGLVYSTPDKVYPIKRIKGAKRFEIIQNLLQNPHSGEYYRFQIINDNSTDGYKMELLPPSYETRTNCIVMYYIRNANNPTTDSTKIDIPEFYSFIKAYVKYKIYDKEGSVKSADALVEVNKERELMLATLAEMVPDYDSEIPPDLSLYEEMS